MEKELQPLTEKQEQGSADEKLKNEHLPKAGNRVSELRDMFNQKVDEITVLQKQSQEIKGLSTSYQKVSPCASRLLSSSSLSKSIFTCSRLHARSLPLPLPEDLLHVTRHGDTDGR